MAILSKGNTYSSGDSVTAANLNSLVDSATFVSGSNATTDNTSLEVHSGGYLQVKDDGITNAKIATGAVNADSIAADAVITAKIADDGVTTAKIAGNAITSAKISDTDDQFLVDDTSTQKKVVVNEVGADVDFRVEGDTDQNLLVCDATNDRVVIGADAPTESSKFAVVGNTTGQVVASIENAAATGSSVLVLKGPDPIIQCQDTTASTGKTFNIGVQNDSIYIDLISGGSATRLFQLSDAGQLQLKSGTSPILFNL